jgi:hypothetical protein
MIYKNPENNTHYKLNKELSSIPVDITKRMALTKEFKFNYFENNLNEYK